MTQGKGDSLLAPENKQLPSYSGFLRSRVIQLHLTRRCNLACKHCYSSSDPHQQPELTRAWLAPVLADLRGEGYDVICFSGGEPFIHKEFFGICDDAQSLGYKLVTISNGVSINRDMVPKLKKYLALIGISIDGPQELHDSLRGEKSFSRTLKGIRYLREANIPFGIAHCVTRSSLKYLPWLLEFCLSNGGGLMQLHPLVPVGRGSSIYDESALTPADLARLYLMVQAMRVQVADKLQIQLDVVPSQHLSVAKQQLQIPIKERAEPKLSCMVNPLIVDELGQLWPLAYGMAGAQRIACGSPSNLRAGVDIYKKNTAKPLRQLIEHCLDKNRLLSRNFVDWYALAVTESHKISPITHVQVEQVS